MPRMVVMVVTVRVSADAVPSPPWVSLGFVLPDRSQSGASMGSAAADHVSARLPSVATALWSQAESRRLASALRDARIPAMVLKGPDLQERLYGTPAAYAS